MLLSGIEALMVLTLIILKEHALLYEFGSALSAPRVGPVLFGDPDLGFGI